jgi:hypothetical protein
LIVTSGNILAEFIGVVIGFLRQATLDFLRFSGLGTLDGITPLHAGSASGAQAPEKEDFPSLPSPSPAPVHFACTISFMPVTALTRAASALPSPVQL